MTDDTAEGGLGPRGAEEGRFAATWHNKAAGRALRAARQGVKQSDFAALLSRELGVPISTTALSGWETGRRQVPAPVWLAATMATNQSLDALLGEAGAPEVAAWAEGLGLPQRLAAQAEEIQALRSQVAELREKSGRQYADVVQALTRAGIALSPPTRQTGRAGSDSGRGERRTAG